MLILIEHRGDYGSLVIEQFGQRFFLYLKEQDKQFFEEYPLLTHLYPLRDILTDKVYYIYTENLKRILERGTVL